MITISQLKRQISLFDLALEFTDLDQSGKGLCPFPDHTDSKPSFAINRVEDGSELFYCYGCARGGSIIDFVMLQFGLDFNSSIDWLADRYKLDIAGRQVDLTHYFDLAAKFKSAYSKQVGSAQEYLEARGITPAEIADFGLGYCPGVLNLPDAEEALAEDLGFHSYSVFGQNITAFLKGRLIFPLADKFGRTVAFAGRSMDGEEPKYLNTTTTPIYSKSMTLYNYARARKANSKRFILVEGYFDVIAMVSAGFPETVATCGTALTESHINMLRSRELILVFDADSGGERGLAGAMKKLGGLKYKIAKITGGKDADEVMRKHGPDSLHSIVEGATSPEEAASTKFTVQQDESALDDFARVVASMRVLDAELAVRNFSVKNQLPVELIWQHVHKINSSSKTVRTFDFTRKQDV